MSQSYVFSAEHRDVTSELRRLQAQVDLSWRQEERLLRWIGLPEQGELLSLGCGPGFALKHLQAAWPNVRITGIDQDPDLLAHARTQLGDSARLRVGMAEQTNAPNDSFDFVLARYLFQHLAQPRWVAQEALRVLKPGGRMAVIDIDDMLFGVAQPTFDQLPAIHAKAGGAQQARGGDRLIGRKLYRILEEAGFVNVELEMFAYHSDALGLAPFLPQLSPDRLLVAVRQGQITQKEYRLAQALVHKFLASPNAYVMMIGFLAHGEKPLP